MKFNNLINELLEDFSPTAQDFNTGLNIGLKQLTRNVLNHPKGSVVGMLEVIKKTPGMYADLLTGNMNKLHQKFLQMGVDFAKITDLVSKARELAEREKRGEKIPVKRAIPYSGTGALSQDDK